MTTRLSELANDEFVTNLSFSAEIDKEYRRWIEIAGQDDPYSDQVAIGIHDVLRAHFMIIDFFI